MIWLGKFCFVSLLSLFLLQLFDEGVCIIGGRYWILNILAHCVFSYSFLSFFVSVVAA